MGIVITIHKKGGLSTLTKHFCTMSQLLNKHCHVEFEAIPVLQAFITNYGIYVYC